MQLNNRNSSHLAKGASGDLEKYGNVFSLHNPVQCHVTEQLDHFDKNLELCIVSHASLLFLSFSQKCFPVFVGLTNYFPNEMLWVSCLRGLSVFQLKGDNFNAHEATSRKNCLCEVIMQLWNDVYWHTCSSKQDSNGKVLEGYKWNCVHVFLPTFWYMQWWMLHVVFDYSTTYNVVLLYLLLWFNYSGGREALSAFYILSSWNKISTIMRKLLS